MKPCCVFSWFWKINWQSNYAGRYLWTTYSNMSRKTFIWIIQSILNNFSNKAWENSSYTLTHLRFSLFFCYWELNIVLAKATGSAFIFIKTWDGFRNELSPKKKKKKLFPWDTSTVRSTASELLGIKDVIQILINCHLMFTFTLLVVWKNKAIIIKMKITMARVLLSNKWDRWVVTCQMSVLQLNESTKATKNILYCKCL